MERIEVWDRICSRGFVYTIPHLHGPRQGNKCVFFKHAGSIAFLLALEESHRGHEPWCALVVAGQEAFGHVVFPSPRTMFTFELSRRLSMDGRATREACRRPRPTMASRGFHARFGRAHGKKGSDGSGQHAEFEGVRVRAHVWP